MRISCCLALAALLATGCGVGAKQRLIATALDDDEARAEYLEASLRVLDQHPEYVDEMFRMAREHPETLERFIASATAEMEDPEIAQITAEHLVENPPGLLEVFVRTLDEALESKSERPRQAVLRVLEARAPELAELVARDPKALRALLRGMFGAGLAPPLRVLEEAVLGDGRRDR